ncbi:MAG: D-glycerate dehydrogenase [Magnetospirillum sp.]|nr:MAG: D-glycerate dehydrogenase [Magnetospirillum sp.]
MKPRILVTRRLPPRVEALAGERFQLRLNPEDRVLAPDEIVARAVEYKADGLLVCLTDRLPKEAIEALPASVRAIATVSVGFDHIDLAAARARGIAVTYVPEAVTEATADLALLLLLAACRRAHEYQALMRRGEWAGWTAWKNLGTDPGGKVLGIVGMGRIGRAVAKRARAFGMIIHYHQRTPLPQAIADDAVYHSSLESLFRASAIVSLHTPSTPETRGFINARSLAWLAEGAILINTARGDQVNDDDLIAALASGRLAAAGLDVFAGEPAFDRRYLELSNAYLLPHIGTSTTETRDHMGFEAIDDLEAVLAGRQPRWRLA